MKKLHLFLLSLVFFSFSIFFLGSYFFSIYENKIIEDHYIEPTVSKESYLYNKDVVEDNIEKEKIWLALKSAYNISFKYFPKDFKFEVLDYTNPLNIFFNSKNIVDKIFKGVLWIRSCVTLMSRQLVSIVLRVR